MAHYDCDNCGAYMGIGYGYCDKCTPREVLDAKSKLESAKESAGRKYERLLIDSRYNFIKQETIVEEQKYKELYEKYKPNKED